MFQGEQFIGFVNYLLDMTYADAVSEFKRSLSTYREKVYYVEPGDLLYMFLQIYQERLVHYCQTYKLDVLSFKDKRVSLIALYQAYIVMDNEVKTIETNRLYVHMLSYIFNKQLKTVMSSLVSWSSYNMYGSKQGAVDLEHYRVESLLSKRVILTISGNVMNHSTLHLWSHKDDFKRYSLLMDRVGWR